LKAVQIMLYTKSYLNFPIMDRQTVTLILDLKITNFFMIFIFLLNLYTFWRRNVLKL